MTGVALFVASLIAGALWQVIGPTATFLAGAGFAVVTLGGLWSVVPRVTIDGSRI